MKKNRPAVAVLRRLAVESGVDPRTLLKVMEGGPVRTLSAERALRALVGAGLVKDQGPNGTSGK